MRRLASARAFISESLTQTPCVSADMQGTYRPAIRVRSKDSHRMPESYICIVYCFSAAIEAGDFVDSDIQTASMRRLTDARAKGTPTPCVSADMQRTYRPAIRGR